MKILLGLDEQPYSAFAVRQTATLAVNTWADVTLLTWIQRRPKSTVKFWDLSTYAFPESPALPLRADMLQRYGMLFLEQCPPDSPYVEESIQFHLVEVKEGTYEEIKLLRPRRKELRLRLKLGNPAEAILAEAHSEAHDLIVIGCEKGERCVWSQPKNVPQKVVNESTCSVLVVKEKRGVKTLLCCLDQSEISQESMEMINQMAVIHKARLDLIGLTRDRGIRIDVDRQLRGLSDYYRSRGIDTDMRLQEISTLEALIDSEAKADLLVLWMGKRSLIKRIFPEDWAGRLVSRSPYSVLILR
jgi:nucleotide-binding universal stress UspA family protein